MKILHVTFSFPPDPPAGTEIYVASLCQALSDEGIRSVVAAPAAADSSYDIDEVAVRRFAISPERPRLRELYAGKDSVAVEGFERLLDQERPDLLHQHALTFACSSELMRTAQRRGMPVVFTYHTPTTTCQRGSLLEYGESVCDGRLDEDRCSSCTLHGLGMRRVLSHVLTAAPIALTTWGSHVTTGRAATALALPDAMRARVRLLRQFLSLPDRFVALTPWVQHLLAANGVAADRIVMSRHGLAPVVGPVQSRRCQGPLRIAHLGRLDPVKGTRLLIRAVRGVTAPVELDIFGLLQGPEDDRRLQLLRATAEGDPRVRFLARLEPGAVIETLAGYDILAVPSQWLETGPLVVLEAFAAGIPVIGSKLGGIAEKVRPGVDGVLVSPFASVDAWREAIDRLARSREEIERLRPGVRAPRPSSEVAGEMRDLYRSLVRPSTAAFRTAV